MKKIIFQLVLIAAILLGCGGGSNAPYVQNNAVVINVLAAAGAPLVGIVPAKDSNGITIGPAIIIPSGTFTLTVTKGVAPFVLRAAGVTAGTATLRQYIAYQFPQA